MLVSFSLAVLFGNPLMLWGLLLIVVPLVVQLFLRRQYRDEPWGAMRFLQQAVQRQRQRLRLEQWLRLLLRMLLIGLIVTALARPRSSDSSAADQPTAAATHWIIVWDGSLSMRASNATNSAFDQGRTQILQLVQQAPAGSTFRLVRNCSHQERMLISRPLMDVEALRLELELITPTLDQGDWLATLRDVAAILDAGQSGHTEVALVTDLQANEWGESAADRAPLRKVLQAISQQAGLTLVEVGNKADNLAVTELTLHPGWLAGQSTGTALVQVANHGTQAADVTVDLLLDDHPQQRAVLHLEPRSLASSEIPFTVIQPGEHIVEARIGDDALLEDNRRWGILPAVSQLKLLLIERPTTAARKQPADYLRLVFPVTPPSAALGLPLDRNFELDVRRPEQISETVLSNYDVVILSNVAELTNPILLDLRNFVANGGGLVLAAGEQWQADVSGNVAQEFGYRCEPVIARDAAASEPFLFQAASGSHPVMAPFREHPEAGLESTRIYRYVPIVTENPEWTRAINYSSQDPAILTRPLGAGTVVLITTGLDDHWGSWVLWPSFVPLLRELVDYAATGRFRRQQLLLGDPWMGRHDDLRERFADSEFIEHALHADDVAGPTLLLPDQRIAIAERLAESDDWTFAATFQPGIYTVTHAGQTARFVVNLSLRESDLKQATLPQLQADVLKGVPLRTGLDRMAATELNSPASAAADWAVPVLLLAVGLWVCEILLGRSLGLAVSLLAALAVTTTFCLWWPLPRLQILTISSLLFAAFSLLTRKFFMR